MRKDRIQERIEGAVERAIREGQFDNLPGAGKPLNLPTTNDPDWWIKQRVQDGTIDSAECMPPAFQLRKARADLIANVSQFETVASLRAAVAELNEQIRAEIRRPTAGPAAVVVAELDEDTVVQRWRDAQST